MEPPKLKKIVRKLEVPHEKARFNEMFIKGSRPYAVYQKHSEKVLVKHHTLVIHAMTAAINKAVQLCLFLRRKYPYLHADIVTDSVPTIVEEEGGGHAVRERSAIHITLTKTQ